MPYRLTGLLLAALLSACASEAPVAPASHVCLDLAEGSFEPLAAPTRVFGAGLTYAGHLRETGQTRMDAPPIFDKRY